MSKARSLGLTVVFLAIAVFVSGTLVITLRAGYGGSGHPPTLIDALHLLQRA